MFDWTVKITDLVMIVAIFAGPFLAVYVTERQRKRADIRNRKIHIFRTLMATRSAPLVGAHVEALNLLEVEFDPSRSQERGVVDCWRLYLAHLNDRNYPLEAWVLRKSELLIDLLYTMSVSLGYSYDKSQIKTATYYPQGYGEVEQELTESRKLWLEILRGKKQLPITTESLQPPKEKP